MKLERMGGAFVALMIVVVFGGATRADDAPPSPPAAPVGPKPPAPTESGDPFSAWAKRPPVPAPVWRDAEVVEQRFSEAVDAVELACGAKFATRPTVRISTKAEVKKVVKAELAALPKGVGLDEVSPEALGVIVGALTAKYDLEAHVVHVVPENVERLSGFGGVDLGTEDGLRAVLAHECTHALDFPRFGWNESRRAIATAAEFEAFGAIVEGHAQFVAKQVCATWGISAAFAAFTKAIGALPEDLPEYQRRMLDALNAEATFAYWQGLAFFEAIAKEAGDEGVLRALKTPPKTTREIEHPAEWAHPGSAVAGLDLSPALTAIESLVPPPAWKGRQADLLEKAIRSQFSGLLPDEEAAFEGFQSAKAYASSRIGSSEMFVVLGMRFSTDAQAKAFVAFDRRASEAKDARMKTGAVHIESANYVDGAGADGTWSGATITKVVAAGTSTLPVKTSMFAAGAFAFEVLISGREVERAWLDRVVDALGAYVTDPAHPLPKLKADAAMSLPDNLPLPPGVHIPRAKSIAMTIVGADAQPVARARVSVAYATGATSRSQTQCDYEDGQCSVPEDASIATLIIYGATAASGKPLDLGPLSVVDVNMKATGLRFELPVGHTIEGRVVDRAGKGVKGVKVSAVIAERPSAHDLWPFVTEIATDTTHADGRYQVYGLGTQSRIELFPPPPFVSPGVIFVSGDGPAPDVPIGEGHSAVVTVVDPAGMPFSSCEVDWGWIERPEPGVMTNRWTGTNRRTDEHGRLKLEGIPFEGELALAVKSIGSGSGLAHVPSRPWDGRDVEVRLVRARKVSGRVVDPNGTPVPTAWVHLKGAGVGQSIHGLGEDGRFEFEVAPDGAYFLGATTGPDAAHRRPSNWIPAGVDAFVELVVAAKSVALEIRGLGAGRDVYTRTAGSDDRLRSGKSADGGLVRFPESFLGSRLDVYVIPTDDDPRGLVALGVEVTSEPVPLDLVACVASKGALKASTKFEHLETFVLVPWGLVSMTVAADGTFAVPPLPPGKYTFRAKAKGESAWIYARAEFEPGATLELELKPK